MTSNTQKTPVSNIALLAELNRSLYLIGHYSQQIINDYRTVFGLPLSVELRRLYSPKKGGHLLKRIQDKFDVTFYYPLKYKPPDKYKDVLIDEYISSLAFVSNGTPYTKFEVINLVANQRGAHTDDAPDDLHYVSPFRILPWGNPKDGVLLPQDLHCLLSIAKTTYAVADKQLRVLVPT